MPDPADELKRRIRRVFSFPGLPPEFFGRVARPPEGPPTFPEGPETCFAVPETLQASRAKPMMVSRALAALQAAGIYTAVTAA